MHAIAKLSLAAALAWGLNVSAQAGDMGSVVAYSLGEFDRVGMSQPLPKVQSGNAQKTAPTRVADAAQKRRLDAQKAEFVRRMFWVALSMR